MMAPFFSIDDTRKIVYDVVSLAIIDQSSQQASTVSDSDKDDHLCLDVLLLHGMAPVGRKCWGLKDHTSNNSLMKNGKLASDNVNIFIEAIRQHSNNKISHVRLIMPDRPGYCDSDAAPAVKEQGCDDGANKGYSYAQFATDMLRVVAHATAGDDDDDGELDSARKRSLIVLGTSSGGPCALAIRNRILSETSSLPNHIFLGTITCSSDCPYSHPHCPQAVTAEDAKDLNGRSIQQYVQDESLKRFRRNSKHGFVTDYLLERTDWGFDLAAPSHVSCDDRANHRCNRVHMYVGGEDDYKSIRLGAQFLRELIGDDARLQILDEEDHFYASRKPELLAKLLATMTSPR